MTQKKHMKSKRTITKKRTTPTRSVRERLFETDSTYLLKLIIIVILGAVWLRLSTPITWLGVPFGAFPVGVAAGLLLIKLAEAHQSDRKIWYAVLILVGIVSYFADSGIII